MLERFKSIIAKLPEDKSTVAIQRTEAAFGANVWDAIDWTLFFIMMMDESRYEIVRPKGNTGLIEEADEYALSKYTIIANSMYHDIASLGNVVLSNDYMTWPKNAKYVCYSDVIHVNHGFCTKLEDDVKEDSGLLLMYNETEPNGDVNATLYTIDKPILTATKFNEILEYINAVGKFGWNLVNIVKRDVALLDLHSIYDGTGNQIHELNLDGLIPQFYCFYKGFREVRDGDLTSHLPVFEPKSSTSYQGKMIKLYDATYKYKGLK